ncbi:endoglucanase [Actinopolymorpha cephalotaxi]|uniref:Endoglucanase n=1 Tax=Actinopolymorpha cephalotaxi TaxID=504797 RepID=A0A1I2XCT7_9ACTN|nr:glycoside hydrolase family 9 protein [Actinopolymorpha cephalotaxi]NYH86161.1 endoglucanase [Actinopolymorpha cephalotaxi]SFH10819.1 endoglucanase [Actinopolymorpha cephalotaxi]
MALKVAPPKVTAARTSQVVNGSFDAGTDPWWWTANAAAGVVSRLSARVPGGLANPWDVIIGQSDIRPQSGQAYTLSFAASATTPVTVRATVQLADPPYTAELSEPVGLGVEPQTYTCTFTAKTDTARGSVQFQLGGAGEPWTFSLGEVSLEPVVVDNSGRLRVNQLGYLPDGPKKATVASGATEPITWHLHDRDGQEVATGRSTPRGIDESSDQNVHTIDFSAYDTPGAGYTLTADGQTSDPFDISARLYDQLRSDALQFFYIQRSGIPIEAVLVGKAYARPAGHLGVPPNTGDTDVGCVPGVCDYRLDVRGGWYDAGDQGKYVVNGGIAAYQLLSTWERAQHAPTGQTAPLDDGRLRVPEHGDGVPDILDEARWEVEFLLRMQVPEGHPLAGMAHHKIHDRAWTDLPTQPQDDSQPRELHAPSTAATLNLAAVAAQAARLFRPYDPGFSVRCLAAATRAWAAAKPHPDIHASDADANGGGAYGDADVTDEFYWAAVELYLTIGDDHLLEQALASPVHTADVFPASGFSWQAVGALGRLDLATVPSGLPESQLAQVRTSVVDAADRYLATQAGQAYGQPLPGKKEFYAWGSNSSVLNNIVVMATAYDLTGKAAYRDGALEGMDYIFGRNALNYSYVTGYGARSAHNQHSRIYAHQLDPRLPAPPKGSVAGGPNAALQDPVAQQQLTGRAPQLCYVDDIWSYSTNEVAINWNSALAWAASFAASQGCR